MDTEVGESLEWLESLPAPVIVAPRSCRGTEVARFVPNNDGDKEPDRQKRLTGKTSRPTILLGAPEVHYLWPIAEAAPEAQWAIHAARYLSCVGWGIDMAYGDGRLLDSKGIAGLYGIRWFPKPDTIREDGLLRVPIGGTMMDLMNAHQSALNRIEQGKPLRTVQRPSVFDRVFYASSELPIGRPCAVFALRTPSDDTYRYPHAQLIHIAGMTRFASIRAMREFPPEGIANADEWNDSFVAGHRTESQDHHKQISYVPLPSIGHEHADAMIRRVMIIAPFGCDAELRHLASQLDGERLQPEGGGEGPVLDRLHSDGVTRQYVGPSKEWGSVTPVILPGHDDRKPEKTIKLIERALAQSGIELGCQFTWAGLPNFKYCLTAHKLDRNDRRPGYIRPDHLKGLSAVHLRITFEHPVEGPLTVGAGRHCGLGVMAALNEQ